MLGRLTIKCPEMPCPDVPGDANTRMTTEISADVIWEACSDGLTAGLPSTAEGSIIFPAVAIRKHAFGFWIVDKVTATGNVKWPFVSLGLAVTVTLQPEDVLLNLALPVKASGTIVLPGNGGASIKGKFPACMALPTGGLDAQGKIIWVVRPVIAYLQVG